MKSIPAMVLALLLLPLHPSPAARPAPDAATGSPRVSSAPATPSGSLAASDRVAVGIPSAETAPIRERRPRWPEGWPSLDVSLAPVGPRSAAGVQTMGVGELDLVLDGTGGGPAGDQQVTVEADFAEVAGSLERDFGIPPVALDPEDDPFRASEDFVGLRLAEVGEMLLDGIDPLGDAVGDETLEEAGDETLEEEDDEEEDFEMFVTPPAEPDEYEVDQTEEEVDETLEELGEMRRALLGEEETEEPPPGGEAAGDETLEEVGDETLEEEEDEEEDFEMFVTPPAEPDEYEVDQTEEEVDETLEELGEMRRALLGEEETEEPPTGDEEAGDEGRQQDEETDESEMLAGDESAEEATAGLNGSADNLAAVFASSGGDTDIVNLICTSLATPERQVSPTHFHNSVHNAAAGYWSIATGSRMPSTSLSAYDGSFGAGLMEAAVLCCDEAESVLLVAYDSVPHEPLHAKRPLTANFSAALLLRPAASDSSLAGLTLAYATDVPETRLADGPLEALRLGNPAARALPLLQLLAKGDSGELVLPSVDGIQLSIQVAAV